MGHRISTLNIAQMCAKAPLLSQAGASRAAAVSTCFHALCADDPKGVDMLTRLTDEEQSEIMAWRKPTDVKLELPSGPVALRYEDSEKEFTVALTADGSYCEETDPACVTVGHPDFAWVLEADGQRIAVVGDLKRSEWTVKEGTDSLQLMAYLIAYADKHGCELGFAGLWSLIEGQWQFSEMLDLGMLSETREKLVRRIVASATNTEGDYSMGEHCNGCYGRLRCPAYLMPPEVAESSLAPFTAEGSLTSETIAHALELATRAKATAEAVLKNCKAAVYAGCKVELDGKRWIPVQTKGRASIDTKSLEADMPEVVQKYTKLGAPFDTFRWVKVKS